MPIAITLDVELARKRMLVFDVVAAITQEPG
jgi:hypothetical protein